GSWGYFRPTMIDIGTYIGTFGLFFTLFLLFLRWLPMIAIAEVKGVIPAADPHNDEGHEFHASEGGSHDPDLELAPGE
ncbi:MAG: hydrogenase, partial [Polyangiaceae bacterium]